MVLDKNDIEREKLNFIKGLKGTIGAILLNVINICIAFLFLFLWDKDYSFILLILFCCLLIVSLILVVKNFVLLNKSKNVSQLKRNGSLGEIPSQSTK